MPFLPAFPACPWPKPPSMSWSMAPFPTMKACWLPQNCLMVQSQEDVTNLMAESPQLFVDFYNGWAFDMVISLDANEELAAALSADAGH